MDSIDRLFEESRRADDRVEKLVSDMVCSARKGQRFEAAKAAIVGLLAGGAAPSDSVARDAVRQADALLAELDKPKGDTKP